MCQPLPLSLLPLETERTLVNEKLLPGITKVLRVAQNFPQIDVDPSDRTFWTGYGEGSCDALNSVFVFENGPKPAENGVLNLLSALPKSESPSEADFHNYRLEFVKRVFMGHLRDKFLQEQGKEMF